MPGGRGGRRRGQPGKTYMNRSDLNTAATQPVRAVPNQTYGERGQQEAAQQAIPLPAAPPPALTGDTARPTEPVTAGSPSGPGPGPEALISGYSADDDLEGTIRGLYQMFPNSDLGRLLNEITARRNA